MTTSNSLELEETLLINPNLGHPLFLKVDHKLKQNNFQIDLLFVSNIKNIQDFDKSLRHKLNLVPLLEYKWKMMLLLQKQKKKRILLKEKKEKRPFWKRLISIFRKKSRLKEKQIKKEEEYIDLSKEKLKKLKPRIFRGDPISAIALHTDLAPTMGIDNVNYNDYYSPQEYLIRYNIFGNLDRFYKVTIDFTLSEEVSEFLKVRNFVMFDIEHERTKGNKRINHHSLVISKNHKDNFNFVHATDLHLAERNDRMYSIIKKWTQSIAKETLKGNENQQKNKVSFFKKIFKLVPNKKLSPTKPLKNRLINPNNNFRKFIKLMNQKVLQNDLEFIVLTGDLIDFTILSKLPKDVRKILDFDYEQSNWRVFKEIVLNLPQKKRRGVISGEELMCPIFTLPGNHDYRPFHYDLRWGGLYRKIGLSANEAIALNDKLLANPISSITKSFRALKAYLMEINPSLDFFIKFGNNNFIFLNSGSDSFKNLRDFMMGRPSVTGVSSKQIKYLENLINYKISENSNTFLFLHGPPINPKRSIGIFKRFEQWFSSTDIGSQIDELKESLIQKVGKALSKARIDLKFDVKFGTISSNWEKLVKFCKDHTLLTLCGHTHELKEFRLGDPEATKSTVFQAPPFSLKKIENPAAIYYDLYSEIFTNPKDIEKNTPFVVQTPALGMGGYHNPKLVGAFREVMINKKKLSSFKVDFINR
ncbi:MAG: metallophosphoesterase [Candidatus Heimdallarchaeota archaeon]